MRLSCMFVALLSVSLLLSGCTSNSLIRKDLSPCDAANGNAAKHARHAPAAADPQEHHDREIVQACGKHFIEEHGGYALGFVEFDDLGLPYERKQMNALLDRVRREAEGPLTLVVFVHGWRHNAAADDSNVEGVREMLRQLAQFEEQAMDRARQRRKVFGIYVGWRGLSLQGPALWEYVSFWDRKAVATHVAQGSVRELFAELRLLHNSKNANSHDAAQPPAMRMIIVGHSFGGLIVYHAISQYLLESAVEPGSQVRAFGDLVVLVNPAFEASRYDALHAITARRTYTTKQRPVFIAVTAQNDGATGRAFPIGRFFNSVFESERTDRGRQANKKTVGHIERYRTHVVRHCKNLRPDERSPYQHICACADSSETPRALDKDPSTQERAMTEFETEWQKGPELGLKENWVRHFCGGAVLSHVKHTNPQYLQEDETYDPNNPFWIVSADSEIVDGHNGISKPAFTDFLRQVFHDTVE